MVDPMNALRSLQPAIDDGDVELKPCARFENLKVLLDYPNGEFRLTYVAMERGKAQAIVQFCQADAVQDLPCFSIGYAVQEDLRGKGLATTTVANAIEEFQYGFRRTPLKKFYVEAIVSRTNDPSNKIAKRFISGSPVAVTDEFSGEPAFQYLRLLDLK